MSTGQDSLHHVTLERNLQHAYVTSQSSASFASMYINMWALKNIAAKENIIFSDVIPLL